MGKEAYIPYPFGGTTNWMTPTTNVHCFTVPEGKISRSRWREGCTPSGGAKQGSTLGLSAVFG